MPLFEVPACPPAFPAKSHDLWISGTFEMQEAEYQELLLVAAPGETGAHISVRSVAEICGQPAELYALVGLHSHETSNLAPGHESFGGRAPWLHYRVELRTVRRPRERAHPRWEALSEVLSRTVPEHSASLGYFAEFPKGSYIPAVRLPIALDAAEVPGFSEIAGVRLAQRDPENLERDLYSVILDSTGFAETVQVRASTDTGWETGMLTSAFHRATSVIGLAVTFSAQMELL